MTEAEWLTTRSAEPLRRWCRDAKPRAARKERLFACACCRRLWELLTSEKGRAAVTAAEAFADGLIGKKELARARDAASRAAARASTPPTNTGANWHPADAVARAAHQKYPNDVLIAATIRAMYAAANFGLRTLEQEDAAQADLVRDIFGNPFRPVAFAPAWRTDTAVTLARTMYESRDFGSMPILADALQDAGCDNDDILDHCRDTAQVHVRGCWVCDLVLGKV